jgi:hypothetical protein
MREVSEIGQFVCNSSKSARFHENGILKYAQTVTELDVTFLEQIRDEAAVGMDAFDMIASMDEPTSAKQVKLASYLLTVLERIAARLESYYTSLSHESIYHPEIENNPARTRWNNVRRKIVDGSFFVLAKPPDMSSSDGISTGLRARQNGVEVDFAQIFASAQQQLQLSPQIVQYEPQQPRRLADMHTARASKNAQATSTFDLQQSNNAIRRMSTFINENMSTIRRLSKLPAEYDFAQLMATYGKHPQAPDTMSVTRGHTKTPSTTSSSSSRSLHVRGMSSARSPLPAPQPLRTRTQIAQSQALDQLNHRGQPGPPPKDSLPQLPTPPMSASPTDKMNAAMVHLNRRQPPRSGTPLPASPRASLALSAAGSVRRKLSNERALPVPPIPIVPSSSASSISSVVSSLPAGLRALKLGANSTGDERMFQQVQARV